MSNTIKKVLLWVCLCLLLAACSKTVDSELFHEELQLGLKYLAEGNYEEAIIVYDKLIQIDKKSIDAYKGLATAYVLLEDYEEAESTLHKGLKEVDEKNKLRLQVAEVYKIQNHYEKAKEVYETIIEEELVIEAFEGIADYHYRNNHVDEMLLFLQHTVNTHPESPEAYLALARAYIKVGKTDEAYLTIQDALRVDLHFYDIYDLIGQVREPETLVSDGNSMVEAGDEVLGHLFAIHGLVRLQEYEQIIERFEQVAELNENIRVKTIAALAYRQLGKIEKANEIIANIPIEEIETLSVLRELVIYFRDIGEDETAVELAEKALSFNYEAYPFYLYLYELTGEQIYLDQLQILKDIDMQLYGMTPSITDANVTELFPGWLMTEEKELSFGFKDYKILILQQDLGIDHYEAIIKVAVVNYNNRNQKWTRVWESDEFESYIMFYSEDIVENIQMTTPKKTKALFAFDFNFSGGSSGHYENIVFSIDMNGQGHLVWYDENFRGGHMEKENNQISLFHPFGKSIFNVKKGQLIVEHVSRSEMAPEGAIEAFFEIGSLGVVASEDRFLQIPAGSTVAVVPNSEQARQMFDEREIGLYMGWAPVTLAHAYYVYIGNYFTLNEPGIYQIVLTVEDGDLDFGAPEPTFIIEVYEGEEPTQLPAASTERNEDNLFDVTKLQWGMTVDEVQSLYPNDQLTPETMEDMVYFQIAENRYAHTSCVIDDSLYLFFEGGRLNFIQSEMNLIDECNIEGNGNNQQLELGFQELYVEVSNDFESNTLSAQMVAGSRYEQWDGGNSSYSLGFYADMYSETLQPYALFRISKVRDGAVVGR